MSASTVLLNSKPIITLASVRVEFSNIQFDYSEDRTNKQDFLQRIYKCINDLSSVEDGPLKTALLDKINKFEVIVSGGSQSSISTRDRPLIKARDRNITKLAIDGPEETEEEDLTFAQKFKPPPIKLDEDFIAVSSYLRNDYPCDIEYQGLIFPSVEHAFQAAKTEDPDDHQEILDASSIREAKKIGRGFIIDVNDWEARKVSVMHRFIWQKFSENTILGKSLVNTYPTKIIMISEKDSFWGMNKNMVGQNQLGEILMTVRDDLRVRL